MPIRVTDRSSYLANAVDSWNLAGDYTIACLVKGAEVPQQRTSVYEDVFSISDNTTGTSHAGIVWDHESNDYFGTITHSGNGNWPSAKFPSGRIQANRWHVLAGTYNATTQVLTAYADGVPGTPTTSVTNNATTSTQAYFFVTAGNVGYGSLDKTIVWGAYWNRVLSRAEITALARRHPPEFIRQGMRICCYLNGHKIRYPAIPSAGDVFVPSGSGLVQGASPEPDAIRHKQRTGRYVPPIVSLVAYRFRNDDGDLGAPP